MIYIIQTGTFQAGDPAPSGYLDWHEWARIQYSKGIRQRLCKKCSRWVFPNESCNCESSKP